MTRAEPADLELVGAAVTALRKGLGPELHPAAAAVRTSTGRIVTGLALGSGCAEVAAVGAALALGEPVRTLATVRHLDRETTRVTAPCPSCRRMLTTHAPGVRVLHLADGLRVGDLADVPSTG